MNMLREVTHREGVWWYEAPLPGLLHRCTPWTTGWLNLYTHLDRCACGAMRRNFGRWHERNSRRWGG